jgi:hypothetical protein
MMKEHVSFVLEKTKNKQNLSAFKEQALAHEPKSMVCSMDLTLIQKPRGWKYKSTSNL